VQPVLGLELLGKVHGIIDEGETGALAATKVCAEPKGEDAVSGAFVHLSQLLPDLKRREMVVTCNLRTIKQMRTKLGCRYLHLSLIELDNEKIYNRRLSFILNRFSMNDEKNPYFLFFYKFFSLHLMVLDTAG
jgi:hypothetical protein